MSSVHALAKRRAAVTEWSVEKYFAVSTRRQNPLWLTWLRLRPRTGRTHQIRVHLADLRHPLVGDKLYAPAKKRGAMEAPSWIESFPRQALHAERLRIEHPQSGERKEFVAPLAADLRDLLCELNAQSAPAEVSRAKRG